MPSSSARSGGRSRRRRKVLLGLLFLLGVLAVLAFPLLTLPGHASSAERDLQAAMASLRDGNVAAADRSVAQARENVDDAQDDAQSLGGDVLSHVPFVGTPVADARHLVQALDDATSVAEIGVDLYPSVAGKQATLFREQTIDRKTLDEVIAGVRKAGAHLTSAQDALDEVRGTTPLVGGTISAKRDAAADRVTPMAEAFSGAEPMLDDLPKIFGFEGRQRFLISMLNPAELRYSGGTALSFAPMTWDQGHLELGAAFSLVEDDRLRTALTWPGVRGNPFHRTDTHLASSTFAPSWSVSGEELLRAWHSATGDDYDGVMAIDVVTMSRLLAVTGPVTVPDLGQLTASNLVETLVGSYDDYYPDASAQDRTSASAVVGSLQAQLFNGGDYVAKGRAFKTAADGRHLALYFRDPGLEEGFSALGLDGDLASPDGDYLGVFTQSLVGSKVDYWQRRSIDLDVTLDEDGQATNQLDVLLDNDTPPFVAAPLPDPRQGYFTRWSTLAASVFLPRGASVEDASLGEQSWDGKVRRFYEHSFVAQQTVIPPAGSTHFQASYTVPGAAEVSESGELTYHLAVDPQGTVFPASAQVTVHLPDGYEATSVPEGWSAQGSTVTFSTDALESSEEWEITVEPTD